MSFLGNYSAVNSRHFRCLLLFWRESHSFRMKWRCKATLVMDQRQQQQQLQLTRQQLSHSDTSIAAWKRRLGLRSGSRLLAAKATTAMSTLPAAATASCPPATSCPSPETASPSAAATTHSSVLGRHSMRLGKQHPIDAMGRVLCLKPAR